MPNYSALGTGPISFLDNNAEQQEIPLSAVFFGPSGVDVSAWPGLTAANTALVEALVAQLVTQGFLVAGTTAATTPPLTVTAAQGGTAGNGMAVQFSAPTNGQQTVTVTATQTYTGLTLGTVGSTLGTSAATATGLVFLQGAIGANSPSAPVTGNISGTTFEYAVSDGTGGTSFTLESANSTPDAANIQIVVTPSGSTFTLAVSYTNTASNLTVSQLEGASNPFAAAVNFSGDIGDLLPVAGTVTLQGGMAASGSNPAQAATASVASS